MTRIKYDLISYKIVKILTFVLGVMAAAGIIFTIISDRYNSLSSWFETIADISAMVIIFCAPLFVIVLAVFLSECAYFRRLKAYGYEIPGKKSDYGGNLQNVKHDPNNAKKSVYAKYSIFGAVGAMVIMTAFIGLWIYTYVVKFSFLESPFNYIISLIFYLSVWITLFIFLIIQSNTEKFRDDGEIDACRKERWSPSKIVVLTVILVIVCLWVNCITELLPKIILNSRIREDRDRLCEIGYAVKDSVDEYDSEEIMNLISYEELLDGTDIVSWGTPDDELQENIAYKLGITDFNELRDDFFMSDDAGVYVEIDDEKYTMKMINTYEALKNYYEKYCANPNFEIGTRIDIK